MFNALVVTQGDLAHQLVEAALKIVPGAPRLGALGLAWEDDLAAATNKIREAIDGEPDSSAGTLVLVDMVGSTPCNAARALAAERRVEVVAGVNLPMVVKLACGSGLPTHLGEVADWLTRKAQGTICRPESQRSSSLPDEMEEDSLD